MSENPTTWREHLQRAIDDVESRHPMGLGCHYQIVDSASRADDAFSAMVDADGIRFAIVVTASRLIVRPCSPAPVRSVRHRGSMPPGRAYVMADAVSSIRDQMGIIG